MLLLKHIKTKALYKKTNHKQALHMWGFTKPIAMLIKGVKVKLASEEAVYITDGTHYVELCRDIVSRGERIMFAILYEQARVGGEILLKEWYISKRDSLIELELSQAKAKKSRKRVWVIFQ